MDQEAILKDATEDHLLEEAGRRRFLYSDVEELLQTGHLSHTVRFGKTRVTLRSLSTTDFELINVRSDATEMSYLGWSLAAATWVVDGFVIEGGGEGSYYVYSDWVSQIPRVWIQALGSCLIGLRNRTNRALRMVEAYCYEPYSRSAWRLRGRNFRDVENCHPVIKMWAAYNAAEDDRFKDSQQWSHTAAIVAAMSNKGYKHINKALSEQDEREDLRRREVIEKAVNWVIRGDEEEDENVVVTVNGQQIKLGKVHSARSVEDLEEEMRKVFSGEQDLHDYLVEQYHEQIRKAVDKRRDEQEEAYRVSLSKMQENEEDGYPAPSIVGYTREQLDTLNPEIIKGRRTSTIEQSSEANRLYDRYVAPRLVPGVMTPDLKIVNSDRVPEPAREAETLQDKIAKRRPTMS